MSNTTIVVALLSVLVGYIGQAVKTGSLLGTVTVPSKIIPYLTILGTFLTAGVLSIQSATVQDKSAWIAAGLAGLMALTGSSAGITIHQHMNAGRPDDKKAA